jgi:sulfite oxidase
VRVGAGAATITVAGVGLGELLRRSVAEPQTIVQTASNTSADNLPQAVAEALPNADDPVIPAPGTRPEVTPLERHYRIDINASIPSISAEGFVMPVISRLADGERTVMHEYTLDEIRAMPSRDDYVTMACISNRLGGDLISTVRWTGVSMQNFLATLDVPSNATHLQIMSYDGFDETVSLDLINSDERIMLAYEWEGQPLLEKHGFPLRIHIPDRYGMKQPKWIIQMEFIEGDREGYWVRRGWDRDAIVRSTSVIDTVAVDSAYEMDGGMYIPIGGIAWSGARGISSVDVRIDNGEWQAAEIRSPVGDRTWSLWRYDWAFQEGMHTFEVKCAEGDGTAQIDRVAGTYPSGATGIVSRTTFIEGQS